MQANTNDCALEGGSSPFFPSGALPAGEPRRRILVVDDDPDMRHLLFHVLRADGYRVVCVDGGHAGWEALCASSFDAMITDYDMPGGNGLELLRRVRAGPVALPVILISGAMPWEFPHFKRLLAPGLAIEKPFRLLQFLSSVHETFGRARRADVHPKIDRGCNSARGLPARVRRPHPDGTSSTTPHGPNSIPV